MWCGRPQGAGCLTAQTTTRSNTKNRLVQWMRFSGRTPSREPLQASGQGFEGRTEQRRMPMFNRDATPVGVGSPVARVAGMRGEWMGKAWCGTVWLCRGRGRRTRCSLVPGRCDGSRHRGLRGWRVRGTTLSREQSIAPDRSPSPSWQERRSAMCESPVFTTRRATSYVS